MKLKKAIKKVDKMRREGKLPKIKFRKVETQFGTFYLLDNPLFKEDNKPIS